MRKMYDMLQLVDVSIDSSGRWKRHARCDGRMWLRIVGKLKFTVHLTGPSQPTDMMERNQA